MKYLYFITLILVAGVAIATDIQFTAQFRKARKPTRLNPVVRLTRDGRTYCSGTVIDETTILTASHCVVFETPMGMAVNQDDIEIIAADNIPRGTFARVKLSTLSLQLDRVLLKGDFKIYEPQSYINDVATSVKYRKPGTKLVSCGYPLGGDYYCSTSVYTRSSYFSLTSTAILIPGMSGGPTMLEDGRVIGVNIAVNEAGEALIAPSYNIDLNK